MLNAKRQQVLTQYAQSLFQVSAADIAAAKGTDEETSIEDALFLQKTITDEGRAQMLARYMSLPYKNLDLVSASEETVRLFTPLFIETHHAIVVSHDPERAVVAIADPEDFASRATIQAYFPLAVEFFVASDSKIQKLKSLVYSKSTATAVKSKQENDNAAAAAKAVSKDADITNSPAVKTVDDIIRGAVASLASDIHIEPFENSVRVRYRIDGVLQNERSLNLEDYAMIVSRIKIMGGMNIAEKRVPQDGRAPFVVNGTGYDLRISSLPDVNGEKIVIRILDTENFNFTRENLHFLPEENAIVDDLIQMPYGIILLTGPTGSGKSTTLYSFIKEVNSEKVNIITVEDPIEYTIDGVNQVQVNNKANLTFAAVLRSILRQDPNIIMIGEIRDEETAEMAIRMSITGHLVFSTLHTNDSAGAISRLIDLKVQPYFVADALSGVISQRLLRHLCPYCKKAHETTPAEMKILELDKPRTIYDAVGCPTCRSTGYRGRIAVHEILRMTDPIRSMIIQGKDVNEIRAQAVGEGMLLLKDTGRKAVLDGETDLKEYSSLLFSKEGED